MITVLFGSQSNVGLLSLPLLIYHPSQIMIGSLLIKPLKDWVKRSALPAPSDSGTPELAIGRDSGGGDAKLQCLVDISVSPEAPTGAPTGALAKDLIQEGIYTHHIEVPPIEGTDGAHSSSGPRTGFGNDHAKVLE